MDEKTVQKDEAQAQAQAQEEQFEEHILGPMEDLQRSLANVDNTIRQRLLELKRLFQKSKGRGQATLTEHVQLYNGLYSLVNILNTQNMILAQQSRADVERNRLHALAVQDFLFEELASVKQIPEEEKENRFTEWKTRLNELAKIHRERFSAKQEEILKKHKDSVLEGSLADLKRPPLEKKESAEENPEKIIKLPT